MRAPIVTSLAALVALAAAGAGARATPAPFAQVDVSHAPGLQAEVAIAIDPENDQVLLAGSNSLAPHVRSFSRVYSSSDGGGSWTSLPGPPALPSRAERRCSFGDPTVAIGRGGVQYYGFLSAPCDLAGDGGARGADPGAEERRGRLLDGDQPRVSLEVASRTGPGAAWRTAAVFPVSGFRLDDKPALAVDVSPTSPFADRVYAAWTRTDVVRVKGRRTARTEIVVSRSDDRGGRWAPPVIVSRSEDDDPPVFASLALDRAGAVVLAWTDARQRIWLDRSTDGGASWRKDLLVDTATSLAAADCTTAGISIPAQRRRCITPVPTVLLDDRDGSPERIYVTYSAAGTDGQQQDVFVAAFDPALAPLLGPKAGGRHQVNPADGARGSDQFMPAAALDRGSGRLWVCYYDTSGDRRGERAVFTCTASGDGGATWTAPVHAAKATSNTSVRAASFFQFGDYQGLAVSNGVAHPIWTDTRDLATRQEEIYTTVLTEAEVGLQPAQ